MWGDNINFTPTEEDNINWKNRYQYVRNTIDDFNYIVSQSKTRKVGQVHIGICPFPTHNEKTGSFTIYPKGYVHKGITQDHTTFYCFGCGEGGDVIKFKQLVDGLSDKKEACKILEREYEINVNDDDIRSIMLKENLTSVKNSELRSLDFNSINMISSGICREYLSWIRRNFPDKIYEEFEMVQKFYKHFDNEILEYTMQEAKILIDETEMIINERRNQFLKIE